MKYTSTFQAEPYVTVDMVKLWMNITHDLYDEMLKGLIYVATEFCENYTGMSYREQRWLLTASPSEMALGITLAHNPVVSLERFTCQLYGEEVPLLDNQYVFEIGESRSFVVVTDLTLLRNVTDTYNSFKFEFTSNIDRNVIKVNHAVVMLVAFYYENRGDTPDVRNNKVPPEILVLLEQERFGFV